MERKQIRYVIKGMNQDMSISKYPKEYSFKNKNIRISTHNDFNFLTITNEKGDTDVASGIVGYVLGHCKIKDNIIIFSTTNTEEVNSGNCSNPTDYIYNFDSNKEELITLYSGNLNFKNTSPIEALGIHENELLEKVYWVDGRNPLYSLNIKDSKLLSTPLEERCSKFKKEYFSSEDSLQLNETYEFTKEYSYGEFHSGILQYAFSYFNINSKESPIVDISPIIYLTKTTRGGSPEESAEGAIRIKVNNVDTNYQYLRIYSLFKSSIESPIVAKKVIDLPIHRATNNTLEYLDTNSGGELVDVHSILLNRNASIIPKTLAQKDNTLFLGNNSFTEVLIEDSDKQIIKEDLSTKILESIQEYSNKEGYRAYTENQESLTHFHSKELYYVGLQFQYKNGNYSEPLYIGNITIDYGVKEENGTFYKSIIEVPITPTLKGIMDKYGAVRVRPLIQYPKGNCRVLYQGVLNPTVYNIGDRIDNSPYCQPSWYFRPMVHHKIWDNTFDKNILLKEEKVILNMGNPEYRHDILLPNWLCSNAEIESCQYNFTYNDLFKEVECSADNYYLSYNIPSHVTRILTIPQEYKKAGYNYFAIDASIVNMFGFGEVPNIDRRQKKVSLIGLLPIEKSNVGYKDFITESPQIVDGNNRVGQTFNKIPTTHYSRLQVTNMSYTAITRGGFWNGYINLYRKLKRKKTECLYLVYPFHSKSTLNNSFIELKKDDLLLEKIAYSYKYCGNTIFYRSPLDLSVSDTVSINENKIAKLEDTYTYFNSINKIIGSDNYMYPLWSISEIHNVFRIPTTEGDDEGDDGETEGYDLFKLITSNSKAANYYSTIGASGKYPIYTSWLFNNTKVGMRHYNDSYPSSTPFYSLAMHHGLGVEQEPSHWNSFKRLEHNLGFWDYEIYPSNSLRINRRGTEVDVVSNIFYPFPPLSYKAGDTLREYRKSNPIEMIYESRSNIVIRLGENDTRLTLPEYTLDFINTHRLTHKSLYPNMNTINYNSINSIMRKYKGIEDNDKTITYITPSLQSILEKNNLNSQEYLYTALLNLGTLYYEDFIPDSENIINSRDWFVAGYASKDRLTYNRGDSYYGKTKVTLCRGDNATVNKIYDTLTFNVESKANIYGMYSKGYYEEDIIKVPKDREFLSNPIYSSPHSFFSYTHIDSEKRKPINVFTNQVIWSTEKKYGELTDSWLNITGISAYYLEGNKGGLSKLLKWNNELLFFQDTGFGHILFNSRVQIPTSDGVPIEITNGLKVEGVRYVSESLGCSNKWSIAPSPFGVYFLETSSNGLYNYNGQLNSISDSKGFKKFFLDNYSKDFYYPKDNFTQFISFYSVTDKRLYLIKDYDNTLVYNEELQEFESFVDYHNTTALFSLNNHTYSIHKGSIWKHNSGEYNVFRGIKYPFSIHYKVVPEGMNDRIFSTIEMRADSFNNDIVQNTEINRILVSNEYQKSNLTLRNNLFSLSNKKQRNRIWRIDIPRPSVTRRMRNPWIDITIEATNPSTRNEIHDLTVSYYE